jgi:hypothetical protein
LPSEVAVDFELPPHWAWITTSGAADLAERISTAFEGPDHELMDAVAEWLLPAGSGSVALAREAVDGGHTAQVSGVSVLVLPGEHAADSVDSVERVPFGDNQSLVFSECWLEVDEDASALVRFFSIGTVPDEPLATVTSALGHLTVLTPEAVPAFTITARLD